VNSSVIVVPVDLGTRSYDIVMGAGVLQTALTRLATALAGRHAMLVTADSLRERYAEPLARDLGAGGFAVALTSVPAGEGSKSAERAFALLDEFLSHGLDRRGIVIALGGGVIGDLAGFAASIYMRGIALVQIPTTLLAQVDASVGGKVAVNHPRAKNLIGSFHQPRLVLIDPLTLRSLPARELRSGLAEVIKHGVIADASLFDFVEANLEALLALDADALLHVIRRSCELKAGLVARDERDEIGARAVLNYGHTVGHALEAQSYGKLTHGEAVALGMAAAARIARRLGIVEDEFVLRQDLLLERAGLPTRLGADAGTSFDALLEAMQRDKKTEAGQFNFVLPERFGSATLQRDVSPATVRAALEELA